SQAPAEPRQTVDEGANVSGGQSSLAPSQLSATSQSPAVTRHSAVLLRSAGQSALVPSHDSGRSQSPAADRHTVPAGTNERQSGAQQSPPAHTASGSPHTANVVVP